MIIKTLAYHSPSAEGLRKIAEIRRAYSAVYDQILKTCPESRERSVALTELETSAMWAVKAVVVNDPESQATTE